MARYWSLTVCDLRKTSGYFQVGYSKVTPGRRNQTEKGRGLNKEENEARSVRRSKNAVKLKVLAMGFDHLLTLTYRENVTDLSRGKKELARFVRLVHEELPTWKFTGCWEVQKRGAIHWHLAVRGFQNVKLLRACWLRAIGGVAGAGNIDVSGPREGWSPYSIASYLTKYITKASGAGRGLNEPRYVCSKGIKIPMEKTNLPEEFPPESVLRIVEGLVTSRVGEVVFESVAEDGSFGFVCGMEDFQPDKVEDFDAEGVPGSLGPPVKPNERGV